MEHDNVFSTYFLYLIGSYFIYDIQNISFKYLKKYLHITYDITAKNQFNFLTQFALL